MDLLDQEGYIFRMGVNGAIRWGDRIIRGRDTSIIVNDDYWTRVLWFEARAEFDTVAVLGSDETHELPNGARGLIELLAYESITVEPQHTVQGMRERVAHTHTPATIVARLEHPDTGAELQRWTFHGVQWTDEPIVRSVPEPEGPASDARRKRHIMVVPFHAEWFDESVAFAGALR